ncbi:hypothetical protein CAOG_05921 [Capsaspora owczarzaki ATCC 30864]|uniref:Uncharacterized protein n=1 Tax=Capsaspora owczarzaki (strain ATCC 30864) TaxID=595528 RepID=A0A0D2VVG2_CAPO3|nr:hypothetical protein CAOG_05921 [Capsaspora owczarzaki ATCC 30864]KJE95472.1 hypothetical protein CAOG_005921 [Capsaspora owczarzaki ATCC 30864]|eukprot:XP_004345511.1 hypothetical protein CAOG_05921 [Capsaspora owczarzaki ATCC 30864]
MLYANEPHHYLSTMYSADKYGVVLNYVIMSIFTTHHRMLRQIKSIHHMRINGNLKLHGEDPSMGFHGFPWASMNFYYVILLNVTPSLDTSKFHVLGPLNVTLDGVAPVRKLQNIFGNNWPMPPMGLSHVTYCYMAPENEAEIAAVAKKQDATFRNQAVWKDGNRIARLVYHKDGAHTELEGEVTVQLVIEDVIEGFHEGKRFLQVIYQPKLEDLPVIPRPDRFDSDSSESSSQQSGTLAFTLSQVKKE